MRRSHRSSLPAVALAMSVVAGGVGACNGEIVVLGSNGARTGSPEAGAVAPDSGPCTLDPAACASPMPTDASLPYDAGGLQDAGVAPYEAALPYDASPGSSDAAVAYDVVAPPPIDAADYYDWLTQAMVGTWEGTRTDPWQPDATVLIHFEASGLYTAHCVAADTSCTVWYVGIDDDLPDKTYALNHLNANQTGVASITIALDATNTSPGSLDFITIDGTGTQMTFDFTYANGPLDQVHFQLQRVGP